jgi:hypothetical protein
MPKRSTNDGPRSGNGKVARKRAKTATINSSSTTIIVDSLEKNEEATTQPVYEPFPLLELPREIRDHIYGFVAEYSTGTLDRRARGNLITSAPLARTNKQLRDEFMSVLHTDLQTIVAKVSDFDFRHLVTFFNRLSDREHRILLGVVHSSGRRNMVIRMGMSERDSSYPDSSYLMRWVKRAGHPTKKGANVECSYEASPATISHRAGALWLNNLYPREKNMPAGATKSELAKIWLAVARPYMMIAGVDTWRAHSVRDDMEDVLRRHPQCR